MKKIIFAILASVLFFSCEKYIDMEIPNEGRKITVNSIINDQTNPIVYLHKSRFILDGSYVFTPINAATVTLYKEGVLVSTLIESESEIGVYKALNYIPEKGFKYSIEVTKYEEMVSSETTIPNLVGCELIDTVRVKQIETTETYEYLRFNLKINDPSAQENYYMVSFYSQYYQNLISFYNADQIIENGNNQYLNYAVFSDKLINGLSKTIAFDIAIANFTHDINPITIECKSISKDMYLYYLRLSTYRDAAGNFLAEPVMLYTNIKNGLGIFGGYSKHSINFKVPKLAEGSEWEGSK